MLWKLKEKPKRRSAKALEHLKQKNKDKIGGDDVFKLQFFLSVMF